MCMSIYIHTYVCIYTEKCIYPYTYIYGGCRRNYVYIHIHIYRGLDIKTDVSLGCRQREEASKET